MDIMCCLPLEEPLQSNDNAYIGQAALLPPLSAANCKRSISYGVLIIKNNMRVSQMRFLVS